VQVCGGEQLRTSARTHRARAEKGRPETQGCHLSRACRAGILAILLVGLAEQLAALVWQDSSTFYREDPYIFWALNPGHHFDFHVGEDIYINSLGMRAGEPDGGHPSLLILGDSCTYGVGVADGQTLDAYLQTELSRRVGRTVRVWNGGVPGYSTWQAKVLTARVAPILRPDVVIVCCYYGDRANDLVSDDERIPPPPLSHVRAFLWKSDLYRFLRHRILGLKSTDPTAGELIRPGPSQRVSPAEFRENLNQIFSLARRHGSRLGVGVMLPDRALLPRNPQDEHHTALISPEAPDSLGIDLRVAWADRGLNTDLLFWDDMHPTARGYALIAHDLAEALMADPRFRALLEPPPGPELP
jgi:lysophospholipase L1-like esterase